MASEPYQAYGAPRVADFTGDQSAAFAKTRNDIGHYGSTLDAGANTIGTGVGMNALNAAQPYMNAASGTSVDNIGAYMNPYMDNVVDRLGDLGARNLNEKLMPAIGDQFTRAGQYGSTRMQEATGHALRDTQESTLAAQNQALAQGYGQALSASQADLSRYGNLGQVAGNLTNTNMSNLTNAGAQLGTLAQAGQGMDLKDTAALSTIGGQQQQLDQRNMDTAYSDFQDQRDYPKTQLGFMNSALRGIQMPTSTTTSSTGPAATYSASPLASLTGGLAGISSLFK